MMQRSETRRAFLFSKMTIFVIIALAMLLSGSYAFEDVCDNQIPQRAGDCLTVDQKQGVLDLHNLYRQSVAPPASNMIGMYWDRDLANDAQEYAWQCPIAQTNRGGEALGFILTTTSSTTADDARYSEAMAQWAAEAQWYSSSSNTCSAPNGKSCIHYLQMINSQVWRLGCGIASCPNVTNPMTNTFGPGQVFVCQYAPGVNLNAQPYLFGIPCTQCRGSFMLCDQQLCAAPPGLLPAAAGLPNLDVLQQQASTAAWIVGIIIGGIVTICLCIYTYYVYTWYINGMYGNKPSKYFIINPTPVSEIQSPSSSLEGKAIAASKLTAPSNIKNPPATESTPTPKSPPLPAVPSAPSTPEGSAANLESKENTDAVPESSSDEGVPSKSEPPAAVAAAPAKPVAKPAAKPASAAKPAPAVPAKNPPKIPPVVSGKTKVNPPTSAPPKQSKVLSKVNELNQNATSADSSLPANWQEHKDAQGRAYYYNTITKKTQWSRP